METEDTNVHKKYLNIACIVLGIPAAILAAFEINYGIAFILMGMLLFIWAAFGYIDKIFFYRGGSIHRNSSPIKYWAISALLSIFAMAVLGLGILILSRT